MARHPVELILIRQLASTIAVPMFVVDAAGDMVFFNEPAEQLLGLRLEDVREMPYAEWTTTFQRTDLDQDGQADEIPLARAVRERRPAHGPVRMVGRDGIRRRLEVTAFPIEGAGGQLLGGVAMFWESDGA